LDVSRALNKLVLSVFPQMKGLYNNGRSAISRVTFNHLARLTPSG
jgi:hypothetical protein